MNTLLTVIGARPQIIKAAAINRTIRQQFPGELKEIIVHTGQHYDHNMSAVFFDELEIPEPEYNLEAGSGHHGAQTAQMIDGLEKLFITLKPAAVLVYGDTNSTLAAAVTAGKLHIPVIHVEAGLRSFNKQMPEEINRIVCDHTSTLLFSPTAEGIRNLSSEGFNTNTLPPYSIDHPGIFHCGDVMYDNAIYFRNKANEHSVILNTLDLENKEFLLTTIHRDNNTDDPERFDAILRALIHIVDTLKKPLVWPLHPRTEKMLNLSRHEVQYSKLKEHPFICLTAAVPYLDMIQLESKARLIITDSGGVQKEAYFFHKPCVILRPQTEWVELVQNGNSVLADANESLITGSVFQLYEKEDYTWPRLFGDGRAAEFICTQIISWLRTC